MIKGHAYKIGLVVIIMALAAITTDVCGQGPYPPPMPVPPAPPAPQRPGPALPAPQPQQGQQGPLEYAFKPDLSNPEFGECLQLEKGWQGLWQRYAQYYQKYRVTNPNDPEYQQLIYMMQQLKFQLDSAWNEFSNKCIYFPRR